MVRFSFLAMAVGLQPVVAQFCGIQSSCSSCLSVSGCVWNLGACTSMSSVFSCNNDAACTASIGLCPAVVYASIYPSVSSTVLPPVVSGAATMSTYPIYSTPMLPAATTVFPATYPVYTAPAAPVYTAPVTTTYPLYTPRVAYPLYSSTTVLPAASASLYARPAIASTPLYSSVLPSYSSTIYTPPVYTAPAAPLYPAPAIVPRAGWHRYGNGWRDSNGALFDIRGQPVYNFVRNNAIAGALEPLIPGIGGVVSTGNDINFLRNAPQFLDGIVDGQGYNRNPLYAYARADIYANQLGRFVPGLEGPLDTLNTFNLYASILR